MNLKLGMHHRGLKLYKVYINEDPGLTLTYFTARSNSVTLAKIISGHKLFICQPIFKIFVAPGCKRMTISYFAGGVSEQDDMQKAVSKRWCKESSIWISA